MDDAEKDKLIRTSFKQGAKVEVSRFKGLGEMPAAALKETTMDPKRRVLLKVCVPKRDAVDDRARTDLRVEELMGRRPELRFQFIQDNASTAADLDV